MAVLLIVLGLDLGRAGTTSAEAQPLPVGWSQGPSLPPGYSVRWDFSYEYFPPTGEVVVFGGTPALATETWRNDTWIFNGAQWRRAPDAPAGLTPRGGAAMAYHPGVEKLVMFGGAGPNWPPFNETWLFDGATWTRGPAAPADLAGRTGAQMVYYPEIGKIVLFGGSGFWPEADTWLFDGSRWEPGPPTPAGMSARVFFGMAYDPGAQRVVVGGGNGGTDVWYLDGTSWTRAPAPLPEARERFTMAHDPQLGGVVMFGGLGPGIASSDMWVLRDDNWSRIELSKRQPDWPDQRRIQGALLWNAQLDALMLFGGIIDDFEGGTNGFKDVWFFRESPPHVNSVTVTPEFPLVTDTLVISVGPAQDGYGSLKYKYTWLKNGVLIDGADLKRLRPDQSRLKQGDEVQARVRVTDQLGLAGPWVGSNVVTVGNRAPSIRKASLEPAKTYVSTTIRAVAGGVKDPDGDEVTLHYRWTVNGQDVAGNDIPTLSPDHFGEGDGVMVVISVVDEFGTAGNEATSTVKTIEWNIDAVVAQPGQTKTVHGHGFAPTEVVQVRFDVAEGPMLGTATADVDGDFTRSFVFPEPLEGGQRALIGVGQTSGIVGPGPLTVIPVGSIDKVNLAAGDTTTFRGMGFVPGEAVSLSFPHGPMVQVTAGPDGSVTKALESPPEPDPGGIVVASAASGSVQCNFSTVARFYSPESGRPGDLAAFSLTGYGPNETIELRFDEDEPVEAFATDETGSLASSFPLAATFGGHDVVALGTTSRIEISNPIDLDRRMTISPTSGRVGTVISVESGPGWIPGETVQLKWINQVVKILVADLDGVVRTNYTIPSHSPGDVLVRLTGLELGITITATFTITP